MSRVLTAAALVLLASACGEETFDLLPPPESPAGGVAGMAGGQAASTSGAGFGGRAGSGQGGSSTAGGPPSPDCPAHAVDCRGCRTGFDCQPGETCDPLRYLCTLPCYNLSDCDPTTGRSLCLANRCVECVVETDCPRQPDTLLVCERGACVEVECVSFLDCPSSEPVCDRNECRLCRNDRECGTWVCELGLCRPPPQPGPGG